MERHLGIRFENAGYTNLVLAEKSGPVPMNFTS